MKKILLAVIIASATNSNIYAWSPVSGNAKDLGVSANGTVWKIGTTPRGGYGFDIARSTNGGTSWQAISGGAVRIDAMPNGKAWAVNKHGQIWKFTGNTNVNGGWKLMPGRATDIGVGANGRVWKIGVNPQGNYGYDVSRWRANTQSWETVQGGAVRIDVDPQGRPWVVNKQGIIWRRKNNGQWQKINNKLANDISVGPNGNVWIISKEAVGGYGYKIYRRNGPISNSTWIPSPGGGAAEQISVGPGDPNGNPWVANRQTSIYRKP